MNRHPIDSTVDIAGLRAMPGSGVSKYSRWYFLIVAHARGRALPKGDYCERHHVLPQALYPNLRKDKTNIVKLTAREHFVCHWLLTKMVTSTRAREQMLNAFGLMMRSNGQKRRDVVSGWRYEACRRAFSRRNSTFMSRLHKGKTLSPEQREKLRELNKGKRLSPEHIEIIRRSKAGKPRSEETKRKVSEGLRRYAEEHGGVMKGRKWSKESVDRLTSTVVQCPHCGKVMGIMGTRRWHFDRCKQAPEQKDIEP